MKVLILSVTAGEGHNSAARAIGGALTALGAEVVHADAYREVCPLLHLMFSKGYPLASKLLGPAYGAFYYALEKRKGNAYRPSTDRRFHGWATRRLSEVFLRERPDVVVCTHPFSGMVADILIEKLSLPCRAVGVVTDFVIPPYWEEALRFDALVLPDERMREAARAKGFADEQIFPLGLPIHEKFASAADRREAKRALGLDPELPVLLLMGGITGTADPYRVTKVTERLDTPLQTLVITGRDRGLYRKMKRHAWKKTVLTFPFVDNVDRMMDAADLVVTKPGGLTSAEALAKGLPLVMSHPIEGQEAYNRDFLTAHAEARELSRKTPAEVVLPPLLEDAAHRERMTAASRALGKPHAARHIAEAVLSLGATPVSRRVANRDNEPRPKK